MTVLNQTNNDVNVNFIMLWHVKCTYYLNINVLHTYPCIGLIPM